MRRRWQNSDRIRFDKLQLHHDRVDQRDERWSSGVNDRVRRLAVQRITLGMQIPQPCQRIVHLQERALDVVSKPAEKIFRRRSQVDHVSSGPQNPSIGLPQDGASARGHDAARERCEFCNYLLLDIAKARLAFSLEMVADGTAEALLDDSV